MEKTRQFQIVCASLTNLCQHSTTDLARGIMMNNRRCRRHDLLNIRKLKAMEFYGVDKPVPPRQAANVFFAGAKSFVHYCDRVR